jgi:hypothetical protein
MYYLVSVLMAFRVQSERTGSLWSLVADHRSRDVLLVLQLHQLAA